MHKKPIRRIVKRSLNAIGIDVSRKPARGKEIFPAYIEDEFITLYRKYCQKTMVPWPGLYTAYLAAVYIIRNEIPGAIVECGVWKGGCTAIMLETLYNHGDTQRTVYLYDTFTGMSTPNDSETHMFTGENALKRYQRRNRGDHVAWCHATLEEVKQTISQTSYPADNIHYIQGKVEETLPAHKPETIALLRLDTDFYESTKAEMDHLYPLVCHKGILICDDYGTWSGAKRAVDNYLFENNIQHFLHIDTSFGGAASVKI